MGKGSRGRGVKGSREDCRQPIAYCRPLTVFCLSCGRALPGSIFAAGRPLPQFMMRGTDVPRVNHGRDGHATLIGGAAPALGARPRCSGSSPCAPAWEVRKTLHSSLSSFITFCFCLPQTAPGPVSAAAGNILPGPGVKKVLISFGAKTMLPCMGKEF